MRIVVIDYGMGNLGSVARALRHVAPSDQVLVSADPDVVTSADRVVFPGQGAMPDCMHYLTESGLSDAVRESARSKPFLGVCMGEQMLLDSSDEIRSGESTPTPGLGLIPGRVLRLPTQVQNPAEPAQIRQKVPHMGWNRVFQACEHPVFSAIPYGAYFYFVHSFYAQPDSQSHIAAQTEYGIRFTSALARDNIFATQFHPEKSASIGLRLYENFLRWNP